MIDNISPSLEIEERVRRIKKENLQIEEVPAKQNS